MRRHPRHQLVNVEINGGEALLEIAIASAVRILNVRPHRMSPQSEQGETRRAGYDLRRHSQQLHRLEYHNEIAPLGE